MMKLVFVYNAKSNERLFDAIHKVISPATYNCDLCKLTHGTIGPRKKFVSGLKKLELDYIFLHKDEFEKMGNPPHQNNYPLVLLETEQIHVLLKPDEIALLTLDQMIQEIKKRIDHFLLQ